MSSLITQAGMAALIVALRRLPPRAAAVVAAAAAFVVSRRGGGSPLRGAVAAALASALAAVVNVMSAAAVGLPREPWPMDRWLRPHVEPALDPDLPIVDPHHHLWDARVHPKGWPIPMAVIKMLYNLKPKILVNMINDDMQKKDPAIVQTFGKFGVFLQPYMGRELLRDIDGFPGKGVGHKVVATVYLECGWVDPALPKDSPMSCVGEAAMAAEVHRQHPGLCNAVVAHADLRLGAAVEPALAAYKKAGNVCGIRHSLAWTEDPLVMNAGTCVQGTAADPKFREGLALLEKYGLTYDVWMFHEQFGDVLELARAFPRQTIVIDHVAGPIGISTYNREQTFEAWKKGMAELVRCTNVVVKLSGLAMRHCGFGFSDRAAPPTSEELADAYRPYFKYCIDNFGADRCMFASNFPVDRISGSYTALWNSFKRITADASPAVRHKLFYGTARRVYSLDIPDLS